MPSDGGAVLEKYAALAEKRTKNLLTEPMARTSPQLRPGGGPQLRPGGGSLGSLRPDASKGGSWGQPAEPVGAPRSQPTRRGRGARGRRGGRRRRKGKAREAREADLRAREDEEKQAVAPRPAAPSSSQSRPSPKRAPPGFGAQPSTSAIPGPAIQMPAAQRSPVLASKPAREPEQHGAQHKTYPFDIMMLYRTHRDVRDTALPITLPKSTSRAELGPEQRARSYPFFTMAKHNANKRARAEEKRQREQEQERMAREQETREPALDEVMKDETRGLDWLDEEVPEEDFDFSTAVLARDLPGAGPRPLDKPAESQSQPSPNPQNIHGSLARMAQDLNLSQLPPMPQVQAAPGMPAAHEDPMTIEARARRAQEEVINNQMASTPMSRQSSEIVLDGELLEDPETKVSEESLRAEFEAERVRQHEQMPMAPSMHEESLKLERLLSQSGPTGRPNPHRPPKPRQQGDASPPPLNIREMFGDTATGRQVWEDMDGRAPGSHAAARDDEVQVKARESLEKMRKKWGDNYLKQYVKMKYGQMMQNNYSQSQYALMQRKMMESLYANPQNGASFPTRGEGPKVDQLRAYYMRYQQFMRKLATTDPARLQKLQMYVMQKYGRMSGEKNTRQASQREEFIRIMQQQQRQRAAMMMAQMAGSQQRQSETAPMSTDYTDSRSHSRMSESMSRMAAGARQEQDPDRARVRAYQQWMLQQQQAAQQRQGGSMSRSGYAEGYEQRGHERDMGDPRMTDGYQVQAQPRTHRQVATHGVQPRPGERFHPRYGFVPENYDPRERQDPRQGQGAYRGHAGSGFGGGPREGTRMSPALQQRYEDRRFAASGEHGRDGNYAMMAPTPSADAYRTGRYAMR